MRLRPPLRTPTQPHERERDMSVITLHVTNPKARKQHQCSCCNRVIAVGETYERQDNVFDGQRYAYLLCAHCRAITNRAWELAGCYLDEGWNEEVIDDGMREYAETLADLRMLVWFRRRWMRADGTLVPVPGSNDRGQSDA